MVVFYTDNLLGLTSWLKEFLDPLLFWDLFLSVLLRPVCIPRESEGLLESSNRDSLGTQEEEGESDK